MNKVESIPEENWRELAVEAVGNVIEFWGFKRNQGRVWAHLYLSTEPKSARELQDELGMSKGSVSMLVRELEYWHVVKKSRAPQQRSFAYSAETDLKEMIGRVLRERELRFISEVSEELRYAETLAASEGIDPVILSRLTKMRIFSEGMKKAMDLFIAGAQLDLRSALDVFRKTGSRSLSSRLRKGRKS